MWDDKFFIGFSSIFTKTQLVQMKKNTWKIRTFLLHSKFSPLSRERTKLWCVETKEARPQLHFAPKNIGIRWIVLENELFEHALLVSKKDQKWECVYHSKWTYVWSRSIHTSIIEWFTHSRFWFLFETSYACSNNSFSKTIQWIPMIFDAKWSWGLACFVSIVYNSVRLLGVDENFEWSKKVRIFQVFFFICTSCVLVKMLGKTVKILSSQIGDGCFFKLSSLVVRTPIFSRFGG